MSKRGDFELLSDIQEAIDRINKYLAGIDYEKFLKDIKTQDAVVRNLEIIGEAVKNLSADTKKKHSQIPWRKMAGLRDKLIHHYFGVNFDVVWSVVKTELPGLIPDIASVLRAERP